MNVSLAYPEPRICCVCGQRITLVATGSFAVDRFLETLCVPCALRAEMTLRQLGQWGGQNVFMWYGKDGNPVKMSEMEFFGNWPNLKPGLQ
jgi:hypothetical protein